MRKSRWRRGAIAFALGLLSSVSAPLSASANPFSSLSATPSNSGTGASSPGALNITLANASATAAKCLSVAFSAGTVSINGNFSDSRWQMNGLASRSSDNMTVNLTRVGQGGGAASAAFMNLIPSEGLTINYDAFAGNGGGADGMAFALLDPTTPRHLGTGGNGLGFASAVGFAFRESTYPTQTLTISHSDDNSNIVDYDTNTGFASIRGSSHHYLITVNSGVMTVKIDGVTALTATIPLPKMVYPTFSGAQGGFDDDHTVTNVSISYTGTGSVGPSAVTNFAPWELNGFSALQGGGSSVKLTDKGQGFGSGTAVWTTPTLSNGLDVTFDGYSGGGTGADGLAFAFIDTASTTRLGGAGGMLGFDGTLGVAVTTETYGGDTMQIRTSNNSGTTNVLATNSSPPSLRNVVRHFHVVSANGNLLVTVDGAQVFNQAVTLPSVVYPAFTAGQGGSNDDHIISNLTMSYTNQLPDGMTVASPVLTGSTALTSGSWGTGTVLGERNTWTNAGGQALSAGTLSVGGITHNPTDAGTYFARINTYSDTGCTTSLDAGAVSFTIVPGVTVSYSVDPAMTFTVGAHAGACDGVSQTAGTSASATVAQFGHVSGLANSVVAQDLAVSANASYGFTVFVREVAQMNAGNGQTIADIPGTNSVPGSFVSAGTAGFGYTTSDSGLGIGTANRFTNGGAKWAKLTTTNAEVSHAGSGPVVNDTVCIAYQLAVSTITPAGNYTTTAIYTAVPTF